MPNEFSLPGALFQTRFLCKIVILLSACRAPAGNSSVPIPVTVEQRFNFVAGTQTIGPAYQFTQEPRLVETAIAILEMGSNILKFSMTKPDKYGGRPYKNINSLAELARLDSPTKAVLDMPFAYYVIWAYPFTSGKWHLTFPPEQAANEYREMYDLTRYLLSTYNGSGKTFYLGHWEGDWHLIGGAGLKGIPTDVAIENMVAWLSTRQKAVNDAKRDTPHQNVQVYHYTEVNFVRKAMNGDRTVTNNVLPRTDVDFVSCSCYDNEFDDHLIAALDYIESKLPPKTSIRGKRVFIGEYGFPTRWYTPDQQDEFSRKVMADALKWGAPFALYWELYNNEVDEKGQRGYWLIDDKGVKQPVYYTHQHLYEEGKAFVAGYRKKNGHLPTEQEYRDFARAWLQTNTPITTR